MILPVIVVPCLLGAGAERPFALDGAARPDTAGGESRIAAALEEGMRPPRLRQLPERRFGDLVVPVANGFRARLLGLSGLRLEDAGAGLLLPRCASVHTFGMRFHLDLYFLDREGRLLTARYGVPPRRACWRRGAAAVLEVPSRQGGEFAPPPA
jgi:uncharacterized protein